MLMWISCLSNSGEQYTVLIIPRFLLRCVSPLTATQARVCTLYRVAMTSLYIAMHWILLNQRAIIQCNKTIAHCTVLECTSLMCHNPLRSNIEHSCKQHSTGRLTICRVTITQIHKHKIELGGTLYSLHLQSDRLGREAAAWNNEPLPSQRTHCKHTFHTAVQESVLFEQRSEHCGDLVPTRPVRQLSMCSPCVLTSKFETPPHHRHNPKLCFIVLLLITS